MKLRELKLRVRELSEAEQATIETWRGTRAGSVRLRDRACIVALSAQGWWVSDIARIVRVSPGVVRKWITRFNAAGLDGLQDQPRSGRPPTYSAEQIGEVIAVATAYWNAHRHPFVWGRRRRHKPRRQTGLARLPRVA